MDAALLTPSKYIKAAEFQGKAVTLTIAGVKIEELEREDNSKERKGVISFKETAKGWVINVTNARCCVAMWGRETDAWIGKRITLHPEPNDQSESGVAIRVKGSPDLAENVTFTLKLARKKSRQITLLAIGKRPQPQQAQRPQQQRPANGNGRAAAPPPAAPPPDGLPSDDPPETPSEELDEFERGFGEPPPQ